MASSEKPRYRYNWEFECWFPESRVLVVPGIMRDQIFSKENVDKIIRKVLGERLT